MTSGFLVAIARSTVRWLVALCFASAPAQAAGLQYIDVSATADPRLSGGVWYPCATAPQDVTLSDVIAISAVKAAMDCPVQGNDLPLVVISHGRGGSFSGHHDTAAALADAGFVVAAITHPTDTAIDISIAITRPAEITRLIDFMLDVWPAASKIDRNRIGFFGHSRGGYTGLVLAGGNPNFRRAADRCAAGHSRGAPCELFAKDGIPQLPSPIHDPRIKALVIADPGFTFMMGPDELKGVSVPVQLWGSEYGGAGVTHEDVAQIARWLPSPPDHRVVPKSGHWAFLPPCSADVARAVPKICVDAQDFDRVAFHNAFNAEVLVFFRRHLARAADNSERR